MITHQLLHCFTLTINPNETSRTATTSQKKKKKANQRGGEEEEAACRVSCVYIQYGNPRKKRVFQVHFLKPGSFQLSINDNQDRPLITIASAIRIDSVSSGIKGK